MFSVMGNFFSWLLCRLLRVCEESKSADTTVCTDSQLVPASPWRASSAPGRDGSEEGAGCMDAGSAARTSTRDTGRTVRVLAQTRHLLTGPWRLPSSLSTLPRESRTSGF